MKHFIMLALLALSVAAQADGGSGDPNNWSYYNGASRVVSANNGFIQLETDKAYCNGRIRLEKNPVQTYLDILSPSYTLEVQGSWCKHIKVGFTKDGDNFQQNSYTQTFDLVKSNGDDGGWSGYGIKVNIPQASLLNYTNGISYNQMSVVLTTDSRDDTQKSAYEKLTLEF